MSLHGSLWAWESQTTVSPRDRWQQHGQGSLWARKDKAKHEGCGLRSSSLREPCLHPFLGLHPPPSPPCPGPLPAVLTSLCPPQTAPRPGQGKEAGAWAWVVLRGHRVIKGPSRRRCDWSSCSKNQPVCHRQALVRAHTCKMIGDRQCGNAHWRKLLESVLSSPMDTQPIRGVWVTEFIKHIYTHMCMHTHNAHTQSGRGCQVPPGCSPTLLI